MSVRSSRGTSTGRRVRRGDPIRAKDNRDLSTALRTVQELDWAVKTAKPRPWAEMMLHSVVTIQDDYLECVRLWRGVTLGSQTVFVAKPDRLRNEASRDGVSYIYANTQERTASKAGETDETQIVTPNYLVGDLIRVTISRGDTGIAQVDQQRGRPIDANVDGRAWATIPPVTP